MQLRCPFLFVVSCIYFAGFSFVSAEQTGSYIATGNIQCYQCNIFVRGYQDVCGLSVRKMSNCVACMKVYARSYIHNAWNSYKYTSTETKYCVLNTAQHHRPEGCYTTLANQGYVTQCFCYNDFCNSSQSFTNKWWTLLFSLVLSFWMFY